MENTRKTLLQRASSGDAEAWGRIVGVYQPLIHGWLLRQGIHPQEVDDLTQDVLAILVKELGRFQHGGRDGSFRTWLRTITANRARKFWQAGKCRAQAVGGSDVLHMIEQLEDSQSELTVQWNAEHDLQVYRRLLAFLEQEFEPNTVAAFRRLVLDGARAGEVAGELNMTVAAIYAAKSRVLRRLRQEATELLS